MKVFDVGTVKIVVVPLNPDGTSPAIRTACPATRPVAVGVVQVTMFDSTVAVIVFEIVGDKLCPINTLFDPVSLPPELAPMTMLLAPDALTPVDAPRNTPPEPPPELPPILTVFETFDSPTELDVPTQTQLVTFDAFEPADPPIASEL